MDESLARIGKDRGNDGGIMSRFRDAILLIGVIAIIAVIIGAIVSFPELKRYVNMSQM